MTKRRNKDLVYCSFDSIGEKVRVLKHSKEFSSDFARLIGLISWELKFGSRLTITYQACDMVASSLAGDINLIAAWLSKEELADIESSAALDCVVLCGSQLFQQATTLFRALEGNPLLAKVLVITGGIGHSTPGLYEAVSKHAIYCVLSEEIESLPESRVLERILHRFFDFEKITSKGCRLLIEDRSTNCGSNAIETLKLLEASGVTGLQSCVVVQDPTMMRRTVAGFDKVFNESSDRVFGEGASAHFVACPIFVPQMAADNFELNFCVPNVAAKDLWSKERFYELLSGEIPRLRDDVAGYGPAGKGFIVHVDIPKEVEAAANRLQKAFGNSRSM